MDQLQRQQQRRDQLDAELREIQKNALGYQHTYFEPTEKTRLQYDALVYKKLAPSIRRANNRAYGIFDSWQILWISKDPETIVPRLIEEHFAYCSPGQPYMSDNLHHFPFTIYY